MGQTSGSDSFKQVLASGRSIFGVFVSLADNISAEIAANSDLDWIIVDTEHAPNDLRSTLSQLQATQAYDTHVVVRPYEGDKALLKRMLDIGATNLMIPMVDNAEEASEVVTYCRYPPLGVRGVASSRAARWGTTENYFADADDQVCLIAQIESVEGLANIDSIAAVDGIDALFVGPSDTAAALGHLGNPGHPEVQEAVMGALRAIQRSGKPAGVYGATPEAAQRYREAGASFVIVGVDTMVLAKSLNGLAAQFKAD